VEAVGRVVEAEGSKVDGEEERSEKG